MNHKPTRPILPLLIVLRCTKKNLLFLFIYLSFTSIGSSQGINSEMNLLQKLDSICQSPSISKYFAKLYYNTTVIADNFFAEANSGVRSFMQRLENRFGEYFFEAAQLFKAGEEIPENWSVYFSDTSFSEVQYFLIGANAHINGDIWKALTTEFTLEEIRENEQEYFNFYKGLKKIYSDVYHTTYNSSKNVGLLHSLSLGLDKIYGKMMLKRWRKRQMQLAILYFTNESKFNKKLSKLKNKMDNLNRMICKSL